MSKFKNNLIDTNIFPSFLLSTDLRSLVSNDDINSEFTIIRNIDSGLNKTNVGGWHSTLYTKTSDLCDYTNIKKLYELVSEFIDEFLENDKTNLYASCVNSWLLENDCGSYNTLHNHGKTDLIGVYYVNIPEGCGGLTLLRTDAFTHTALCCSNNSTQFAKSFTPDIDVGRLYVMPGHIYHYVKPFDSEGLRRSIVFNINCNPTYLRQSE